MRLSAAAGLLLVGCFGGHGLGRSVGAVQSRDRDPAVLEGGRELDTARPAVLAPRTGGTKLVLHHQYAGLEGQTRTKQMLDAYLAEESIDWDDSLQHFQPTHFVFYSDGQGTAGGGGGTGTGTGTGAERPVVKFVQEFNAESKHHNGLAQLDHYRIVDWSIMYPAKLRPYLRQQIGQVVGEEWLDGHWWLMDMAQSWSFARRVADRGGDAVFVQSEDRLVVPGRHWELEVWELTNEQSKLDRLLVYDAGRPSAGYRVAWKKGDKALGRPADFTHKPGASAPGSA